MTFHQISQFRPTLAVGSAKNTSTTGNDDDPSSNQPKTYVLNSKFNSNRNCDKSKCD